MINLRGINNLYKGLMMKLYGDLSFESLGEGIEICISTEHRFGTDAFLLADFAAPRNKDSVLDLCTGSGIVALLMKRNFKPKMIYAVEIQKKAHDMLLMSVERSKIDGLEAVNADLKEYTSPLEVDLVTCNPPYKIDNTGLKNELDAETIARHEVLCDIHDVCEAAARSLKFGGRLCLCNRPERLCDVMCAMREAGIEPKRVRFVSKTPKTAPWLFLIEGRKGGKPFMQIEPPLFTVNEADGGYSDEMKRIYKLL